MALGLPKDPAGQKRFLIGALPILAAVGYYQFVHTKTTVEIDNQTTTLETIESSNDRNRALSSPASMNAMRQKLALWEQHMKRLEQLIPLREEVPALLRDFTQRASESGVDVRQYKPEGEEPGQFYTQQTYAVSVIGSYHSIGRFLAQAGTLHRIITPTQVNLVKPPNPQLNRQGGLRVQADFKIHTYIIPPDTTARPAPTTPPANVGN
ncbi:MAG: type 4a pilus biogenesis protein PilO [Gemmatimonadota bacterium]